MSFNIICGRQSATWQSVTETKLMQRLILDCNLIGKCHRLSKVIVIGRKKINGCNIRSVVMEMYVMDCRRAQEKVENGAMHFET
jgi:hypothetical protein